MNNTDISLTQIDHAITHVDQQVSLTEVDGVAEPTALVSPIIEREKPKPKPKPVHHAARTDSPPAPVPAAVSAPASSAPAPARAPQKPQEAFLARIGDRVADALKTGGAPPIGPAPVGSTTAQ